MYRGPTALGLETNSRAELNITREIKLRNRQYAELSTIRVCVGTLPNRSVESVEGFSTQLHRNPFAEADLFGEREIDLHGGRVRDVSVPGRKLAQSKGRPLCVAGPRIVEPGT